MARLLPLLLVTSFLIPSTALAERRRRREPPPAELSQELLSRVNGDNVDDVVAALREIQEVGGSRAVTTLMDVLRSGTPDAVTAAAIEGLGALADPQSIDLLTEFANHRRPQVRILALQSLSAMRGEGATQQREVRQQVEAVLTDALRDSDSNVRATAAQAIGDSGFTDAVPVLFQAFERGVREACAAIGKLGDTDASDRLTTYLGSGDLPTLLEGLAEFLSRPGFDLEAKLRIVEQLQELAGPEVRRFIVSQLAELPDTSANRRLRRVMEAVRDSIRE